MSLLGCLTALHFRTLVTKRIHPMASVSPQQVEDTLKNIEDPNVGKSIVAAKWVKDISVDGDKVSINIEFGYPAKSMLEEFSEKIGNEVSKLEGVADVDITIGWKIQAHAVQKSLKPL